MEITEKKIVVVSIVLVVVGLIALELISTTMTYEEFSRLSEGTRIEMQGETVNVQVFDSLTRFSLRTNCEIPVVIFEEASIPNFVRVEGSKEKYQGKEQIVADTIMGIQSLK